MKRSVAFVRGLLRGASAGFFVNARDGLLGRAANGGGGPGPTLTYALDLSSADASGLNFLMGYI